jgi:hypothetical protein
VKTVVGATVGTILALAALASLLLLFFCRQRNRSKGGEPVLHST